MRRREIKARDIRLGITLKNGRSCDRHELSRRASQSLYETIAVSLFARLPPRVLLAVPPLARDSCSATFSSRIFEQKRNCSQSYGGPQVHSEFQTTLPILNLTPNSKNSLRILKPHSEFLRACP